MRRVSINSPERQDAAAVSGSDLLAVYQDGSEDFTRATVEQIAAAASISSPPDTITPWSFGVSIIGSSSASNDARLVEAIDYARDSGLKLDFQRIPVILFAPLVFTAVGVYSWRNFAGVKLNATGSTQECIAFTGPAYGTAIELGTDAALHAGSVTAATGQGANVEAGARYLLVSTAVYCTLSTTTVHKSEYLSPTGAVGDVVSLAEPLKSSYTTATYASLLKCDQSLIIDFEDVGLSGSGSGQKQTAFKFTRCLIRQLTGWAQDVEDRAFTFVGCWFEAPVRLTGRRVARSGLGYLMAAAGCDQPMFDILDGDTVRHFGTIGGSGCSVTWTAGGGSRTASVLCRGGYGRKVHGTRGRGSLFDKHPGSVGFQGPAVTGDIDADVTDAGVTLQSTDCSIGDISITGGGGPLLFVQAAGKPSDEGPMSVTHGALRNGGTGAAGQYCVLIENRDAVNRTPLAVSGPSADLEGGGGFELHGTEGDVTWTLGRSNIKANASAMRVAYLLPTANGRTLFDCQWARLHDATLASNRNIIQAEGATYTAAVPGVAGARARIAAGKLIKDDGSGTEILFRAIDATIELGADVEITAPGGSTFKTTSGLGEVYRTSRAVATS